MEGQSLNEPLRDQSWLLTISLQLIRQGTQPSVFHSITSPTAPFSLLYTNKPIIATDINWTPFRKMLPQPFFHPSLLQLPAHWESRYTHTHTQAHVHTHACTCSMCTHIYMHRYKYGHCTHVCTHMHTHTAHCLSQPLVHGLVWFGLTLSFFNLLSQAVQANHYFDFLHFYLSFTLGPACRPLLPSYNLP